MRCFIVFSLLFLFASLSWAQTPDGNKPSEKEHVVVVDDESCGCELVFIDGIQTTQRDSLFGFKHEDGRVLVEPRYKFVDQFQNGYCRVLADYYRYGLIDTSGRELIPCIWEDLLQPTEGMVRVQKDGLYGFVGLDGNPSIAPQYRAASNFVEELAVVIYDFDSFSAAYGYINKDNQFVLAPRYEYAYPFQQGYAVVKQYDRYGIINRQGKEVVPIKYQVITSVDTNHLFLIFDSDLEKFALFRIQADTYTQLTDFLYDDFLAYSDGYYVFQKGDKQGYINVRGKECFGLYDMADQFRDGFAMVRQGNHYGILNERGSLVVPCIYDYPDDAHDPYVFHEGLAMVIQNGRYGFVNIQGQIAIPIQYQKAFPFADDRAPVLVNGYWGYINSSNQLVIPNVFNAASPFEYHRAEVVYNSEVFKIFPDGKCAKNCKHFPVLIF